MQPHRGALVLVLGILGILVCALCAPFAWIMGKKDLQLMDAGQMDAEGRGLTQAGMYLGIFGTVLYLLVIVGVIAFVFLGVGAAAVQVESMNNH